MKSDHKIKSEHKDALDALRSDFYRVGATLQKAASRIHAEGYSDYPLFVVTSQAIASRELPMASLLVKCGEYGCRRNYYASCLEYVSSHHLLDEKEAFVDSYKPFEQYACLLCFLREDFTSLLYIPYDAAWKETAESAYPSSGQPRDEN